MKSNPEIHHRRSIRLKGYDYTQSGAYFVTICAFQHDEIFGRVVEGEMRLSPLGEIVRTEWFCSAEIRREIHLFEEEFVVMPNHLHGIVWLVEDTVGADGVRPDDEGKRGKGENGENAGGVQRESVVGADGVRPDDAVVNGESGENENVQVSGIAGARRAPLRRAAKSLPSFIAGFKGAVTSRAGLAG